uniref:VQ motif-containing protein 9 n=1 Tax=Erigeron canadensis TaxID=72917 RepID=UPI001CB8F514|nr:VQ motif-containing protein 9 [Erigeron canadensis]
MEKSCHSSGQEESSPINPNNNNTISTNNNNQNNSKDNFLKHIHKLSHKISKPPLNHHHQNNNQVQHLPLILDQETRNESQPSDFNLHQNPQQQHQPPVYNVSKSDFRDVVQKLTGSPAHERPVQQPVQPVKPQSSRLQRIRPPPLEQIGNRPPSSSSLNPNFRPVNGSFFPGQRPLSPLPPLPSVHATAESPISAYLRGFQMNVTGFNPPPPPPASDFPAPSSPLPFGCLNSPKSQFPMLSPGFPFGFQQLTPLSPTPPAPSPRWKAV